MVLSIFAVNKNLLKLSTFHIWYCNTIDIPPVARTHNVTCGVLNHPGDIIEDIQCSARLTGKNICEDETNNDPVLVKTRWAGSNKRWKEETRMGVTESGNCVTSRQNEDPGGDPGPLDPGPADRLPTRTHQQRAIPVPTRGATYRRLSCYYSAQFN